MDYSDRYLGVKNSNKPTSKPLNFVALFYL